MTSPLHADKTEIADLPKSSPLRAITTELIPASDAYSRRKVRLECGHEVWCSAAAIYKARCRHCKRCPEVRSLIVKEAL